MKKVLCVFGTRPEAIKMAPVVQELRRYPDDFSVQVCVTGQHREMLDQVLRLFDITPEHDLDLMQENQTLADLTSRSLLSLNSIISKESPDWVLIQGDTTTAMAGSLAGFYNRIKIGHIEAGLRTWDKDNPFPEEGNRKIIDSLSDLYFAPTNAAKDNLCNEAVAEKKIVITGNTVIDALQFIVQKEYNWANGPLADVPRDKKLILATTHRRENFGKPLQNICSAFKSVAEDNSDVHIVIPVHPNPNVHKVITATLGKIDNITLTPPLDYLSLVHLLKESYLVVTDSGGLQEEAPAFGKPTLVMRHTTERPEGVAAGVARLIGTDAEQVRASIVQMLSNQDKYKEMAHATNPYGDGQASKRIADALKDAE